MTDGDALLRAILANPDEDTPRLVYADWLQENGDEARARWIRSRVTVFNDTVTIGPSDSVLSFGGIVARGIRDFAGKGVYPDGKLHYRRGFVESVTCTAASWLANADSLTWHPTQTERCGPHCFGGVAVSRFGECECRRCNGTGRVPRPCPPTAQPITAVTLTTEPDWFNGWPEYPDGYALGATSMKFDRWPGITFVLPDFGTSDLRSGYSRHLQRMFNPQGGR